MEYSNAHPLSSIPTLSTANPGMSEKVAPAVAPIPIPSMRTTVQDTDDVLNVIEDTVDGILSFMFGVAPDKNQIPPANDMNDVLLRNLESANRIREKLFMMSDRIGR